LDNKSLTTFKLSDSDKLNDEKKLLISLKLQVNDSAYKKDSIRVLELIENNNILTSADSQANSTEYYTSAVKRSDHNNYDCLESRCEVDNYRTTSIIESSVMQNNPNLVNKLVPIDPIVPTDGAYNDDATGAKLKYSIRSCYAIKNLPVTSMNIDIKKKDKNLSAEIITSTDKDFAIKDQRKENTSQNIRNTSVSSTNNKISIYRTQVLNFYYI
jgi:hypothetical protein